MKFETNFIENDNVICEIISAFLNKFLLYKIPFFNQNLHKLILAHNAFHRNEIFAFINFPIDNFRSNMLKVSNLNIIRMHPRR